MYLFVSMETQYPAICCAHLKLLALTFLLPWIWVVFCRRVGTGWVVKCDFGIKESV